MNAEDNEARQNPVRCITELKQRVLDGGSLSPEEGYALLTHPDKEALYEAAHELTEHFLGKAFDTCSKYTRSFITNRPRY